MRRVLVGLLTLVLSCAANAQTLTKRPVSQNPVTPADMTERLEKSAIQTANTAARGSSIDFCWPSTPEEYQAVARHVVLLVSVVTQDAAELPWRGVFANIDGRETELVRLSSQVKGVRKGSMTFSILGRYREDGFCLALAGIMMSDGYLRADFAMRRFNFNLYKLPGTPPDFIKRDSDPMPAKDAKPQPSALRSLLPREYKGFQFPENLR
jgi:hypothetical protein